MSVHLQAYIVNEDEKLVERYLSIAPTHNEAQAAEGLNSKDTERFQQLSIEQKAIEKAIITFKQVGFEAKPGTDLFTDHGFYTVEGVTIFHETGSVPTIRFAVERNQ